MIGIALIAGNAIATGTTIRVSAGGSLQAALNQAQPGDEIVLDAGATFVGPFTLPNKSGSGEIVIRSSALSNLPEGRRVSPADAVHMPKITAASGGAAIRSAAGAHHYRFIGIEMKPSPGAYLYNVVALQPEGGEWRSMTDMPHDFFFDRCYIHGDPNAGSRRGIAMNAANVQVTNSYISDIKEDGADSQALASWNGPGPFLIQNNYLEGAGENVMFGGQDPGIQNLVPSDIRVIGNHFHKPRTWRVGDPSYAGKHWTVKNLFELKNARRVVIDGNLFEHNWPDAQSGFSILFTVRNQDGTAPWSVVEDVQFTNNIVRNITSAINILGHDNLASSQQTKNITIKNNLFYNIGGSWGRGWFLQMLDNTDNVVVEHNTVLQTGTLLMASYGWPVSSWARVPHTGFVFRNNIVNHGDLGIRGDDAGSGLSALNAYYTNYVFTNNAIIGGFASHYPAGNMFPPSIDAVGFVNPDSADYLLSSTSAYKTDATDGTDLGFTGLGTVTPTPTPT
ncbi:MAG: hypothetical protein HY646_07805, partial [Acidobacteria bacterium]|nr:hypothetical protein [Acidobacteriota bacterium]